MNTRKMFVRCVAGAAIAVCLPGCFNLPAQCNNFNRSVNPLPFPTLQRLAKEASSPSRWQLEGEVFADDATDDAKWYDVAFQCVCVPPIVVVVYGIAVANDVVFLPYNLPASIFLHEDGCLTMEEGVIKWKGKVDLYDYDPAKAPLAATLASRSQGVTLFASRRLTLGSTNLRQVTRTSILHRLRSRARLRRIGNGARLRQSRRALTLSGNTI